MHEICVLNMRDFERLASFCVVYLVIELYIVHNINFLDLDSYYSLVVAMNL